MEMGESGPSPQAAGDTQTFSRHNEMTAKEGRAKEGFKEK